jgi:hypothetical protein
LLMSRGVLVSRGVLGRGGGGTGVVGAGAGVAGAGVMRGGRGRGLGRGVACCRGVVGIVRISSRALRNCRLFSSSERVPDCCASSDMLQTAANATSETERARTRRMLMVMCAQESGN